MALRLALVIDGDPSGAKEALQETSVEIEKLEQTAEKVVTPLEKLPPVLVETKTEVNNVETAMGQLDSKVENTGGRFDALKGRAVGVLTGFAAGLLASGIETLLNGLATAAGEFVNNILSSDPQIQAALTAQAGLVRNIKEAYAEASGAASSYGNNSVTLLRFRQQTVLGELNQGFDRAQDELLTGGLLRSNSLQAGQGPAGSPLAGVVADFRAEMRAGRADVIAFRNEIAEIASAFPEGDANRQFAQAILADTERLAEVQEEIARGNDILAGLGGNAEAAATALGGAASKYEALGTAAGDALPALREASALLATTGGVVIQANDNSAGFRVGGGFAAGGYTGDVDTGDVAGVVHGKEFVVNAAATSRHRGLLEAINRGMPGFAGGGYGGGISAASYGAGNDNWTDLTQDFRMLSGAVNQLVQDLFRTRDPLAALASVVSSVSSSFLNQAVGAVGSWAGNALGNWASGLFGGGAQLQLGYQVGVGHSGATIGQANANRVVPAALFANAPRHHTGTPVLASGERPFIGMEGEEIGWPSDLSAKYGRGSTVNVFNVQTPDPRTFAQSPSTLARGAARLQLAAGRHR
jgi:tetrahydromethanopterin S-methyltransferase subunit G